MDKRSFLLFITGFFAEILASDNGYAASRFQQRTSHRDRIRHEKIPLCLPFISDKVNAAIQQCIFRAQLQDDVVLVSIPNDNIKSNLSETACTIKNVSQINALCARTEE